MSAHPNTLTLHRLRYGELSGDEEHALRAHLDSCPDCAERLRSQQNHRAAFALQPVPEAIAALGAKPAKKPWWRFAWVPLMATAAMFLMVQLPQTLDSPLTEDVRTKGADVGLEAWLDTEPAARALSDGDEVEPGDTIQLRYRDREGGWVSFAGMDGDGDVEVYGSLPAEASPEWRNAPFALTLDDSPGPQRFYAVFTFERPSDRAVERALLGGDDQAIVEVVRLEKAR